MLFERIVSGIIGVIALIIIINLVSARLFSVFVNVIALISFHEYFSAIFKKNKRIIKIILSILGVGFIFITFNFNDVEINMMYIILSFILIIFVYIIKYQKVNFSEITYSFFGFIYIFVLLSYAVLMRSMNNGILILWYTLISVWVNDTLAYFIGLKYGKRKLIPNISPNKTVEGSLGGLLGSITISIIFLKYNYPNLPLLIDVFIGLIIGVSAQIGDLAASIIKRHSGIKDFSKIIPGHGGIIDRLDSILFAVPIIYYIICILDALKI